MDQQIKPPTEFPDYKRTKPRSGGRIVISSLIVLLLVAGVVWWTRHQSGTQPEGGRGRFAGSSETRAA